MKIYPTVVSTQYLKRFKDSEDITVSTLASMMKRVREKCWSYSSFVASRKGRAAIDDYQNGEKIGETSAGRPRSENLQPQGPEPVLASLPLSLSMRNISSPSLYLLKAQRDFLCVGARNPGQRR
ncbi:hypothetical protein VNI00_004241 [Paramarasmius palmivorus]|uniref:Uncharacterized protein n=1 Tax=Paramarasmius palmivorus TaxID=297713 RepID=A0AAW0DQ15_9AGAR